MVKVFNRRRAAHPVKSPKRVLREKKTKAHVQHRNDGKKSKTALREIKTLMAEHHIHSPRPVEHRLMPALTKRDSQLGRPSTMRTTRSGASSSKLLVA
jgi:hypothetical protein